jgi:hypothetical protein
MKKIIAFVFFALIFSANPVLKFFNRAITNDEILCQGRTILETDGVAHMDCDCDDCPNCQNRERKPQKTSLKNDEIFETSKDLLGEYADSGTQNQVSHSLQSCSAKPLSSILNVYKNLNDYYIEFFEQNIVKKPVVTKYSNEELTKMAAEYGVDFYKMRVMLVVEAIYEMNGTKKDLNQIKKMSVPELTRIIFDAKNKFFASLTPEEKAKFDAEHRNGKNKTALKYSSLKSV